MALRRFTSVSLIAGFVILGACDNANFGSGGSLNSRKDKGKDIEEQNVGQETGDDDDLEFPDDFEDRSTSEEVTVDDQTEGNASHIIDDSVARLRKEVFKFGANIKPPMVDFVFVIDNSSSMKEIISNTAGCGDKDLKNNIPSLESTKSRVDADNAVVSLKFHALAPEGKCTSEELYGKSYFPIVEATKGYKQDPCKLTDYSGFIKGMVDEAVKQENAVFVLSKIPEKVLRVEVNS